MLKCLSALSFVLLILCPPSFPREPSPAPWLHEPWLHDDCQMSPSCLDLFPEFQTHISKHSLNHSMWLWWQLCNESYWLDWATFPRLPFLLYFQIGWGTGEILGRFWRVEGKQQPHCSSQGLLLTYWLSFWHETAMRPATVLPSSGPSFGFSGSWVRCLFSSVTKGPSFCRMPTLEDIYSSASTSLVKLWEIQMSKRCLRHHVAQAELFHDLSP